LDALMSPPRPPMYLSERRAIECVSADEEAWIHVHVHSREFVRPAAVFGDQLAANGHHRCSWSGYENCAQ
jgi:hypothetical protein